MGRRAWGDWQRAKKKMGDTKEGLFGEAGDRQGAVCRELILNEWGCLPEGLLWRCWGLEWEERYPLALPEQLPALPAGWELGEAGPSFASM